MGLNLLTLLVITNELFIIIIIIIIIVSLLVCHSTGAQQCLMIFAHDWSVNGVKSQLHKKIFMNRLISNDCC